MGVSEEAVKAAQKAYRECDGDSTESHRAALTAALPHLPQGVGVKVKPLDWVEIPACNGLNTAKTQFGTYTIGCSLVVRYGLKSISKPLASLEAAKAAAQADYEARILSALEPSAARELALEERLQAIEQQLVVNLGYFHDEKRILLETLQSHIISHIAAIRVLSSPDHADAGKVEGDGWKQITDGLNAIGFEIGGGYILKLSYDTLDQYEAARTTIRSALPSAPSQEVA